MANVVYHIEFQTTYVYFAKLDFILFSKLPSAAYQFFRLKIITA